MITILHSTVRGIPFAAYDDTGPAFGFSSRAAYALGHDAPNYPVPSIMAGAYVVATALAANEDYAKLVVWFADGDVLAV